METNDCKGEWINDCPYPECKCAKNTLQENIGFVQTVPNSNFFTSLDQIDAALQYGASKEFIRTGLQNSIKMGFKITK
jgi:hypothetical protein